MDVFFESARVGGGRPFAIEVGFFDTVLEIKEKIQKFQGIPVSKQTLFFNGQILPDDLNVHFSDILDHSHIQLLVAAPPEPDRDNKQQQQQQQQPKPEQQHQQQQQQQLSPSKKIQVLLKTPSSKPGIALEMDKNDTVRRLKEKIHEMDGISPNRLVLHLNGVELQDNRSLQESEVSDRSEVEVGLRPSPQTSSSGASSGNTTGSKKLRVMVQTKCGTKKVPVDVNPSENVGEMRKELQRLQQRQQFQLPAEGYFFIYKQNVMDDDRSFRWHQVGQGDTIEIFNGSITGGS